jgi:hypothetical protein
MWSFIGQVKGKPGRPEFLAQFSRYTNKFTHFTNVWLDPAQIPPVDYVATMENSVFVPAPGGWATAPESCRLYEALEAGAIPVVPDADMGYYRNLYGEVPFVPVSTNLLSLNHEAVQRQCIDWWRKEKARHTQKFMDYIRLFGA